MSLESAMIAHLLGYAGLAALIDNRAFPLVIPQTVTTLPCVTIQRISTPREYTLGGTATVVNARMQVDCWGKSYASAKDTAAQVLAALNQRTGQIGAGLRTFDVLASLADSEADSYEADTGRYRVRIDIRVMYEEGAG